MWSIPASLPLYAYWSLECPGEVQEDVIRCFLYARPSMIREAAPYYSFKDIPLMAMSVPSESVDYV